MVDGDHVYRLDAYRNHLHPRVPVPRLDAGSETSSAVPFTARSQKEYDGQTVEQDFRLSARARYVHADDDDAIVRRADARNDFRRYRPRSFTARRTRRRGVAPITVVLNLAGARR